MVSKIPIQVDFDSGTKVSFGNRTISLINHKAKTVRLESLMVHAPTTSRVLVSIITPVMLSRPTALEVSIPMMTSRFGIPALTSASEMYQRIE